MKRVALLCHSGGAGLLMSLISVCCKKNERCQQQKETCQTTAHCGTRVKPFLFFLQHNSVYFDDKNKNKLAKLRQCDFMKARSRPDQGYFEAFATFIV